MFRCFLSFVLLFAQVHADHTYKYDSLGNRLEKDGVLYGVNSLCQREGAEYDLNGNLINDGESRFSYDSLDRLIGIEKGDVRVKFTYDPFDRCLSREVWRGDKKIEDVEFLWDGDNEIGCYENGAIRELRVLGEGLGDSEVGAAVFVEIEGKSYVPIHDHRGCVVVLVEAESKQPVETYRYTAFGEELEEGKFCPWRFASKRVEATTGLVYFGRRYYSPELGRWITPDPQGFGDGPNLYVYLHNCPLNDFDPYGLFSWMNMWEGTRRFGYGALLGRGWPSTERHRFARSVGSCHGCHAAPSWRSNSLVYLHLHPSSR